MIISVLLAATLATLVIVASVFFRQTTPLTSPDYFTGSVRAQELGSYYYDMRSRSLRTDNGYGFDGDGIRLRRMGDPPHDRYFPIAIIQTALGSLDLYRESNDARHYERYQKNLLWIIENQNVTGERAGCWEVAFDVPQFEMQAPWISAMYQGQGISLLLRAYQLNGKDLYLERAKLAMGAFDTLIEEGGVKRVDEQQLVWYEEYPTSRPTRVLNGFISSLFGLWDMHRITQDSHALELFQAGAKTVDACIFRYDAGWWSYYDTCAFRSRWICDDKYGLLHIKQLRVLAKMYPRETQMLAYASRWEGYITHLTNRLIFRWGRTLESIIAALKDKRGLRRITIKFMITLIILLVCIEFARRSLS